MILVKYVLEQRPIFSQAIPIPLGHAIDIEAVVDGLASLSLSERAHAQWITQRDHRAHKPMCQSAMSTKQGIEILAAGLSTIYIRYRFIYYLARLKVGDVI